MQEEGIIWQKGEASVVGEGPGVALKNKNKNNPQKTVNWSFLYINPFQREFPPWPNFSSLGLTQLPTSPSENKTPMWTLGGNAQTISKQLHHFSISYCIDPGPQHLRRAFQLFWYTFFFLCSLVVWPRTSCILGMQSATRLYHVLWTLLQFLIGIPWTVLP